MRRRAIIGAGLCGLVVPLAGRAQPTRPKPRIGLLDYAPYWGNAFLQRLDELGYRDGRTIELVYRPAEGNSERLAALAVELARLPVDVIVTARTPGAEAAKRATATIPIVMMGIGDPLRAGLVPSLAHPGGNITGNANIDPEVMSKRLQLLREMLPGFARLAFVWNPTNASNRLALQDAERAAAAFGVTVQPLEVRSLDELERGFDVLSKDRSDVLMVTGDALLLIHRARVAALAVQTRLPAMYVSRENVLAGGLVSYGASAEDLYRRGAVYVDRILKGAKPADLPIEQPTRFDLVLNLAAARALGLTIPPSILLRADEVIE
ncbi:MAG: ABC transporter substrate-binding protein [Proteobacteria bacterium]|nr:ABC transporter substrate-binding protein [Pseudomonadota bacterium]